MYRLKGKSDTLCTQNVLFTNTRQILFVYFKGKSGATMFVVTIWLNLLICLKGMSDTTINLFTTFFVLYKVLFA